MKQQEKQYSKIEKTMNIIFVAFFSIIAIGAFIGAIFFHKNHQYILGGMASVFAFAMYDEIKPKKTKRN